MIKEARETAGWLWNVVRNPDVVWVDPDTGEEVSRERWKRVARWHTFKPMWTFYFLTARPGCGCAKRFGLWRTIWCSEHAGVKLGMDDDE